MRPIELTPLFASLQSLTGIGPRLILLMRKCVNLPAGITEPRVLDLLWHLPNGVVDRRAEPAIAEAVPGSIATLKVRILKHYPPPRGNNRAPYKVRVEDETGKLDLVFFHAERKFIERQLPVGEERYVSGRVERYGEKLQMSHPDYIVPPEARGDLPMLEPVYPLTAGLSGKIVQKATRQALERLREVPEWQEATWVKSRGWPDFCAALQRLHKPTDASDVSTGGMPWQRLAYDELLAGQLALALVRQNFKTRPGRVVKGDGRVRAKLADALPFSLTNAQREAMREIEADMGAPRRMLRLLQGDVGSGKTVVALLAMAIAVESGAQAALMAPTEVLARQHLETIAPLAEKAGLRIGLLTGPREGPRPQGRSRTPCPRRHRHHHRHARAVPAGRRLSRPRLRRHRRAAPLRRAPAPVAAVEGRQRRHRRAGHDGDAHPAHAGHDALRRPRRVAPHREAARAQADRHQGAADGVHGEADRAAARAARRGRAGVLGVPVDRKLRGVGARRRRGAARASDAAVRQGERRPAARRHAGQGQGRRHGGVLRPGS